MYTYLLLNGLTLLFPVALGFDYKVHYYRKWLHALAAIIPVGLFFIGWDYWFTVKGVWAFNHAYLVGLEYWQLPLEEWLFFLTVPFACIFIYEVVICYTQKALFPRTGHWAAAILGAVLIILATLFSDQLYTTITFNLTGLLLLINGVWYRPSYLGSFFVAYLIHLIPFGVVNGILTAYPVVVYNNAENFGLRLGTIPVEDTIYSMLLLLMNINLYERFKQLWPVKPPRKEPEPAAKAHTPEASAGE